MPYKDLKYLRSRSVIKIILRRTERISNNIDLFYSSLDKAYLIENYEPTSDKEKIRKMLSISFERGRAEGILDGVLLSAMVLYSMQLYASEILEACAALERAAIWRTADIFVPEGHGKRRQELITKILNKHTLKDITPILVRYGIWNKKNARFIDKLIYVRNLIAHKNEMILFSAFKSTVKEYPDVNAAISEKAGRNALIKIVKLYAKLTFDDFYEQPKYLKLVRKGMVDLKMARDIND